MSLPSPVRVSPLIKFARWSLLSVGVVYGAFHQNRLSKRETRQREADAEHKAIRDAKLALEKKERAEREIKEFELLAQGKAVA
ncbi:hypothetical protein WA026_004095 [Henosepilachna vigintioctopunctata]|uniref:ATP synthase F(0) complex subunit e, mitochondrial n=1 Tax=Henosepilachna vigintioctopunctata TaxID=420089 RepID=A0AAW1UEQ4_9CUCU